MRDRTTKYAEKVVAGKKIAGKSEIAACQRHIDDMARKDDDAFPYYFDVKEAEKHIDIANTLVIGEGTEKQKLHTRGFQNFILGNIFGWKRKDNGNRRYREAYLQLGRQNGKSFLAAAISNDFATFSGYNYGRIFCAATKQEQADIVWDEIDKFIESDPDLAELYKIRKYDRRIKSLVTGTEIKAIGRDTKSADGFRSILAVIDEYHAHPTDQMYKLMNDGQIRVDNALTLAITTSGFNLNSPCYKQYEFCKKVLSGNIRKDTLFIYIAEMDEDDDIWNPENWAKANPLNLWNDDDTLNQQMIQRMREKAIDAKEKQGAELVNFLTKSLDKWVTFTGGALIDLNKWKQCATACTLSDMAGKDCYLGIDLSSGGDLTSIALLFPLDDNHLYIWSHSYMPEMRLQEHIKTDKAPYGVWAKQGLLTLTSGMYGIKTDYKYIIHELDKITSEYGINIIGCGYDAHNASAFLEDLEDILSCDLTEVKQSARSLNDVTKDFQLSVKSEQVEYDKNNALMTWSVINAIISQPNSFGEIKIDKMTQTDRIDVVDAIIDAWKIYFSNKHDEIDGHQALAAWLETMKGGEDD